MKRLLFAILILFLTSTAWAGPPTYYAGMDPASETQAGSVELATDAETVTGSATDKATTPANITARLAAPGTTGGTTPGDTYAKVPEVDGHAAGALSALQVSNTT
ncbi:MAG: hypothetical protein U1B77_01345, partial [Dehalococcoidales bacterium]|nr:hypothetical protein [Dehalococcoidales bacterium]